MKQKKYQLFCKPFSINHKVMVLFIKQDFMVIIHNRYWFCTGT